MRRFLLLTGMALSPCPLLAQAPAKPNANLEEHIQLHEKVGVAHKKVAECLRSGKAVEECAEVFHAECDAIPGSKGFCGKPHGKGHHHPQGK